MVPVAEDSPRVAEPGARPADAMGSFRVAMWLAAPGVAALLWSALCTVPSVAWNAPRLAPSFALAYGLPIYALRDSGMQLGLRPRRNDRPAVAPIGHGSRLGSAVSIA